MVTPIPQAAMPVPSCSSGEEIVPAQAEQQPPTPTPMLLAGAGLEEVNAP